MESYDVHEYYFNLFDTMYSEVIELENQISFIEQFTNVDIEALYEKSISNFDLKFRYALLEKTRGKGHNEDEKDFINVNKTLVKNERIEKFKLNKKYYDSVAKILKGKKYDFSKNEIAIVAIVTKQLAYEYLNFLQMENFNVVGDNEILKDKRKKLIQLMKSIEFIKSYNSKSTDVHRVLIQTGSNRDVVKSVNFSPDLFYILTTFFKQHFGDGISISAADFLNKVESDCRLHETSLGGKTNQVGLLLRAIAINMNKLFEHIGVTVPMHRYEFIGKIFSLIHIYDSDNALKETEAQRKKRIKRDTDNVRNLFRRD